MVALVRRILVADDEASWRRTLQRILRSDYDVLTAETCEEALARLEAEGDTIQLLLLDLNFGKGRTRGDAVLPDIVRRWPSLPIVVVTVEDDAMQASRMLRLGALDYVAKERCAGGLLPPKLKEVLADVELTRQIRVARILVETLQERRRRLLDAPSEPEMRLPDSLIHPLDGLTLDYCAMVLHACGGNVREAARRLHVPPSSLRADLVRWGLVTASSGGHDDEAA